jgi:hypothetical protein
MRTKNAARITPAESEHLARVKSTPCVLCDAPPPSIAHHIHQGDHMTTLALCTECHVGKQGVHGDQTMLRLRYRSGGERGELLALNETLRRIYA